MVLINAVCRWVLNVSGRVIRLRLRPVQQLRSSQPVLRHDVEETKPKAVKERQTCTNKRDQRILQREMNCNRQLCYHRGTARRTMSVDIWSADEQLPKIPFEKAYNIGQ